MKRYFSTIITSLAIILGLIAFAVPVGASPVEVIESNNAACQGNTSVCSKGNDELLGIVKNVINLLLYAAGIISVIVIVIGGIMYTLSAGDSSKITTAKNTVIYAVVGLVVAIMSFAIVNFVIDRLF